MEVSIGDGAGDEFFARGVAENPRAGEIAVQDTSIQRRAKNSRQTPFVEQAVTLFRGFQFLKLRGAAIEYGNQQDK